MSNLFVDIEADAFGASRRHEYEFELSPYQWTYFTRIDLCVADLMKVLERLQGHAPDHNLVLCLGHHSNFRYAVYPNYKSNRRGIRRAAGYKSLRSWLSRNYETVVFPNLEADDVVGLMAREGDLIYSPDKDLKTIKGLHLSGDGEVEEVNQLEADRAFFRQVLVGDSTDGYGGCPGVGGMAKIFASDKWLNCRHEEEFWDFVLWQYDKARNVLYEKHDVVSPSRYALTMARLARILRPGEYDFANEKPVLWNGPS